MSKELKKLVADLQGNMDVVGEFMDSPQSVLDKYNVKGKERTVMLAKDSEGLNNGFESIPRTRFVRIFSRFQRVSISSFRPAVKPKPFDR